MDTNVEKFQGYVGSSKALDKFAELYSEFSLVIDEYKELLNRDVETILLMGNAIARMDINLSEIWDKIEMK